MAVVLTDLLGGSSVTLSASSTSTTVGVSVAVGEFIVVLAACSANSTAPTCTDSQSNTYTLRKALAFNSNADSMCVLTAPCTTALTAGTDTITVTFGVTSGAQAIYPLKAANVRASPVDVDATNTGSSTSPSGTTGTLAFADEGVFAFAAWVPASATFTFDTTHGWGAGNQTETGVAGIQIDIDFQVVSATTSIPWAPSLSVSKPWATIMFSVEGLAAGGTPYTPWPQMAPILAS